MLNHRPHAQGKFIFPGDDKLYIRGVTYGPFCPDLNGDKYHNPEVVERDFAQIAANGLNAVRTYTVPWASCSLSWLTYRNFTNR